jgi:hypothetical protein
MVASLVVIPKLGIGFNAVLTYPQMLYNYLPFLVQLKHFAFFDLRGSWM